MQYLGGNHKTYSTRQLAAAEPYSAVSYTAVFFTFSFIGWLWEILIKWATLDVVVNPGFFHGPWLPIYGAGSVLMLLLFKFFKKNPLETFLLNMIICGIVEYLTSFILEQVYGTVWWDYRHEFMNLNGRVCLAGLLLFGLAGCFIIYFVGPAVNRFTRNHSSRFGTGLLLVLSSLFLLDIVFSLGLPNIGSGISGWLS